MSDQTRSNSDAGKKCPSCGLTMRRNASNRVTWCDNPNCQDGVPLMPPRVALQPNSYSRNVSGIVEVRGFLKEML